MHDHDLGAWFAARVPQTWFSGPPDVIADREEIVVRGRLPDVEAGSESGDALREARRARIERFREESRKQRMRLAAEAERRFGRKVSWGAACGDLELLFTTLSTPVMTRLRMPERTVLDTLVDAGVARSRSDALAWCVRLVAGRQREWLQDLRQALTEVEKVRAAGPAGVRDLN